MLPDIRHMWGIPADPVDATTTSSQGAGTEAGTGKGRIIGASALLWGEENDEFNFHQNIWPRAAALAERFWSDPLPLDNNGWTVADYRLKLHRARLVEDGVPADALSPTWCLLNHGCTLPVSDKDPNYFTTYSVPGTPGTHKVSVADVKYSSDFAGAI